VLCWVKKFIHVQVFLVEAASMVLDMLRLDVRAALSGVVKVDDTGR
jgi:hypothetical protein